MFSHPEEKLWLVVRDHKGDSITYNPYVKAKEVTTERGAILQKNSIIKLGRVRLRVCDIDNESQEPKDYNHKQNSHCKARDSHAEGPIELDNIDFEEISGAPIVDRKSLAKKKLQAEDKETGKTPRRENVNTQGSEEAVCRICWGVDGENADGLPLEPGEINPLISPCKCTGTMGHIHLKCLRGWLQTKRTRKEHKKQVIFKFKKLDCELCKVAFPFKISYNNRIVDIVDVERPAKNFIVLESLS